MEPMNMPDSGSSFLVETPESKTSKSIIFLPGISGKAFSDRFQGFTDAGLSQGFTVARISAWNNAEDVSLKNLSQIQGDIDYVIDYLREQGYTSISAVGKSFGGTVLLTYNGTDHGIERQVLWSPVIGIKDSGSNVDTYLSAPLGALKSLQELVVDAAYMKDAKAPTLIVHGDADENTPLSNSERLVSIMPDAQLATVQGADHSFSSEEHEKILIQKTLEFLDR